MWWCVVPNVMFLGKKYKNMEEEEGRWAELDVELFYRIATVHLLTPKEICNVLSVCKRWYNNYGGSDLYFWQPLNQRLFGGKKVDPDMSWKKYYLVHTYPFCFSVQIFTSINLSECCPLPNTDRTQHNAQHNTQRNTTRNTTRNNTTQHNATQ